MSISVRAYDQADLPALRAIWNEVVEAGVAFPQEEPLSDGAARAFFAAQSLTAAAVEHGEVLGLYILHPNNEGRCGHIANASYAVSAAARGRGVGRALVTHCLEQGRALGFRVLQFNAVVAVNHSAIALYESLGFVRLGVIPGGFRMPDGRYEDIIPFYHTL